MKKLLFTSIIKKWYNPLIKRHQIISKIYYFKYKWKKKFLISKIKRNHKNASQEIIEITRDSYTKKENYSLAAEN